MAKKRRHQPSRATLDEAISEILDKAINADSNNAPRQLHLILTTEHPEWKLPQRRVAKYLKRQLKDRKDPKFEEIDADLDEASIYSSTSTSTWRTGGGSITEAPAETTPEAANTETTSPEPATEPEPEAPTLEEEKPAAEEKKEVVSIMKKSKERGIPNIVKEEAYEDDNKEEKKEEPLLCEGLCIVS